MNTVRIFKSNISISNANCEPLESVVAMNQLPVVSAGRALRTRHGIATDTIIESRPLSLKQKEHRDAKKAKSGAPPFHFPMTYLYPVLRTKINLNAKGVEFEFHGRSSILSR